MAVDHEATAALSDCAQVHRIGIGLAEHHVAAADLPAGACVAPGCPNDQVSQAVAVDVARARHASAAEIVCALAVDHEAAAASSDRAQLDRDAGCVAKHHIAATLLDASVRGTTQGPDDQVGQTVAVDIARTRHADAADVAGTLAVDHKSAVACRNRAQWYCAAAGLAEDHIAATGSGS